MRRGGSRSAGRARDKQTARIGNFRAPPSGREPSRLDLGVSVNCMKPVRSLPLFVLIVLAAPVVAWAQPRDVLDQYKGKATLTSNARGGIRVEVNARVQALRRARRESQRTQARKALTGSMAGAKKAFRDYYARQCARGLGGLVSSAKLLNAIDAVLVLKELDHLATCDALASALGSKFPGVRHVSAKAVQNLHGKIKDVGDCSGLLSALGSGGARETDKLVLGQIYAALDMPAVSDDAALASECAGALVKVFEGRLQRLAAGSSRDEAADIPGFKAIRSCYKKADATRRRALRDAVRRFLELAKGRHFNPDTGAGAQKVLRDTFKEALDAMNGMLRESNVNSPPTLRFNGNTSQAQVDAGLKSVDNALSSIRE